MEIWRKVWREGLVPQLSLAGLEALREGLLNDDPALMQGATTFPPSVQLPHDCGVEGSCAVGYCGWKTEGLKTVGAVEDFFARACFAADQRLGEPAVCRWFLNWFDETPREEMRRVLLNELNHALTRRRVQRQEQVMKKERSLVAA